jgi:predicted O-methyltransferase YrrM
MGRISKPDLVFMDGNHQEEATKRYFLQLLPHISSTSMIIVDDIHWSHGMEKAWSFIQTHKMVNLTIDFFQFGVAFLDPAFLGKSHFKIRY